jgi:hypothetical protein
MALGRGLDFRAQVDGVTQQPLLVGLQIEDAGVAGIAAALENRDRPLRQGLSGGVLEFQSQQRKLGMDALVVDADLGTLDVLVDDRQQR